MASAAAWSEVQDVGPVDFHNLPGGTKFDIRLGGGPAASRHRATLIETRNTGNTLVVQLPFGRAVVGADAVVVDSTLRTEMQYPLDEPVRTPYGLGLVNSGYLVGDTKLYNVELTDWVMADEKCASATIAANQLRRTYSSNAGQLVRIVMRSKQRGDAAFKSRDLEAAIVHYQQGVAHVREFSQRSSRSIEQQRAITPVLTRMMGNLSQAHLSLGHFDHAAEAAGEAISGLTNPMSPPEDAARLTPKFYFRKGQAELGLGQLQAAHDSLTHPSVLAQGIPEAARLASQCRSKLTMRRKKSNRQFQKAFKKKKSGLFSSEGSTAARTPTQPTPSAGEAAAEGSTAAKTPTQPTPSAGDAAAASGGGTGPVAAASGGGTGPVAAASVAKTASESPTPASATPKASGAEEASRAEEASEAEAPDSAGGASASAPRVAAPAPADIEAATASGQSVSGGEEEEEEGVGEEGDSKPDDGSWSAVGMAAAAAAIGAVAVGGFFYLRSRSGASASSSTRSN